MKSASVLTLASVVSAASAVSLFACTTSTTSADIGKSDTPDAASADAPVACNKVAVAAPVVPYTLNPASSPGADMGGTVADGTYYLTGYTIYAGGSVESGYVANQATSVTLVVSNSGTSWSQVQVFQIENTTDTVATNYTASTIGSSITLTPTCPAGAPIIASYTATATALQIDTVDDFPISETLAKQ